MTEETLLCKDVEQKLSEVAQAPGGTDAVQPVRLKPEDRFRFSCHSGLPCWNSCCHGTDITLTPSDILRLCRRLEVRPREFLAKYAVPALHERADLPVAKLKMAGEEGTGPCPFVADEGCTVYDDRPVTCRYYPIGLASIKLKDAEEKSDFHFLVKESFCRGHDETEAPSVREFRAEQGVEEYDRINRGWTDILMKSASWKTLGGPQGKNISAQSQKMFFLVSTDVDSFRRFVFETKFLDTYEIDGDTLDAVRHDDAALLGFGFDWMKNVLFNEPTIVMKETVLQQAVAKAREDMGAM